MGVAVAQWLILRGLVREQRHWVGFDTVLAQHLGEGSRVLCLDLPGVGTERHRPCPTNIQGITDDLRERFLATRSDGPWGIFAASLGGMIALDWASRYPEDFARIAVSNTSAHDLSSFFQRISSLALQTIPRALFAGSLEARERRMLGLISNTESGWTKASEFAAFAAEAPVPVSTLIRQLTAASRSKSPATLSVPLHVLCSDGDRMVSADCSRAIAKKYGARLDVHPSGGHDLPLDDPEWVAQRLSEGARG